MAGWIMKFNHFGVRLALATAMIAAEARADKPAAADVVVMDARAYTEDVHHRTVEALAVRDQYLRQCDDGVCEFGFAAGYVAGGRVAAVASFRLQLRAGDGHG